MHPKISRDMNLCYLWHIQTPHHCDLGMFQCSIENQGSAHINTDAESGTHCFLTQKGLWPVLLAQQSFLHLLACYGCVCQNSHETENKTRVFFLITQLWKWNLAACKPFSAVQQGVFFSLQHVTCIASELLSLQITAFPDLCEWRSSRNWKRWNHLGRQYCL